MLWDVTRPRGQRATSSTAHDAVTIRPSRLRYIYIFLITWRTRKTSPNGVSWGYPTRLETVCCLGGRHDRRLMGRRRCEKVSTASLRSSAIPCRRVSRRQSSSLHWCWSWWAPCAEKQRSPPDWRSAVGGICAKELQLKKKNHKVKMGKFTRKNSSFFKI